jgi:hypothetical protein
MKLQEMKTIAKERGVDPGRVRLFACSSWISQWVKTPGCIYAIGSKYTIA